jgi:hypothetical protein
VVVFIRADQLDAPLGGCPLPRQQPCIDGEGLVDAVEAEPAGVEVGPRDGSQWLIATWPSGCREWVDGGPRWI